MIDQKPEADIVEDGPQLVERAYRHLAFWGPDAKGHSIVMIRGLVAEIERLRTLIPGDDT